MTQKDKLLAKFKNNPASISGTELVKILKWQGFEKEEGKGSHTLYKKGEFHFSIPLHNNDCKDVYKKKICKALFPKEED